MNENKDSLSRVYANYLSRPQAKFLYGFSPHSLSSEFGNALYGEALDHVALDSPIVEIGAGGGHFLHYLKGKGYTRLTGVDLCEPLVEAARQTGLDMHLEHAGDFLARQPDASLGAIIAIDVIEHLTKTEIISLLAQAYRCLLPEGLMLIQTANGQGLFPGQVMFGDITHVTILNPGSLGHALVMAGFTEPVFRESVFFGTGKKAFLRRHAWQLMKRAANFCRWVEANKRQDIWSENMICWAQKPQS
jgi:2-polyprenyl-3-methyl-5-hydroxy-6-metoxy-1,4-benzoquinol methylase